MPKRKEPELDPKEQFRRFQETVKNYGIDEKDEPLEKAFAAAIAVKGSKKK